MTRINVGVPPRNLHRLHLIAEHREIVRIPNAVKSGRAKIKNIPKNFVLGKGHVKFFYDKLLFLKNRYEEIHNECKRRNYNVTSMHDCWNNIPDYLMNDYYPTENDIKIVTDRINERIKKWSK